MIHPKIDLDNLTAQLESIGFEARTRLLFRRGFVDVIIVNGLVPDGIETILSPKQLHWADPFFRIELWDENAQHNGSFNCPIEGFTVLDFQW